MPIEARLTRMLGTMVAYGFERLALSGDLRLATRMGASVVEILPFWPAYPDPNECCNQVLDAGLRLRSVHASWGGQSVTGHRVDLAQPRPADRRASVDDIKRCIDWIVAAGGTHLIVHPGGLSDPESFPARRAALLVSLAELVEHLQGVDLILCVENMPPGVHPGSRMSDLAAVVAELSHSSVGLVLDTGHAELTSSPAHETRAAGSLLRSLHVHDNDGRADTHLPPGEGCVDWEGWIHALDEIGYEGPIVLECIRKIRQDPTSLSRRFLTLLANLTNHPDVIARRDATPA